MSNNIKLVKPNKKKTVQVTSSSAIQGIEYSSDSDETVDMERPQKQKKYRKKKQNSSSKNETFNSNFANLANSKKYLIIVSPNPLSYLLFPLKEFFNFLYCKIIFKYVP